MASTSTAPASYPMAPVIRLTLLGLYLALVAPLPWLAPGGSGRLLLGAAVVLGLVVVLALTSETVVLDAEAVEVGHPPWCRAWLRRGWRLTWREIGGLTPVRTSQGGLVLYVRGRDGSAWLLPQRVDRFDEFLERFSTASGFDLSGVGRITPPWTYRLLALLSALMLAGDVVWALRWAA